MNSRFWIGTLLAVAFLGSFAGARPVLQGPFVSEGPGPVGDILKCTGKKSSFVIRHTAAVTIIQGLYQPNKRSAKGAVSMVCTLADGMWNCHELSDLGGEQLLYARAYENSQGIFTAQIYSENLGGLEVPEDSLFCQPGEE